MEFEEEFLLQRGTRLLITDVTEEGLGKIVTKISAEVIP